MDASFSHPCFSLALPLSLKSNEQTSLGPDQCDSVGRVSFCKAKGCWFDSRSGHMPGFSPQSAACETQLISVSLTSISPPSLSPSRPLSKNKQIKSLGKKCPWVRIKKNHLGCDQAQLVLWFRSPVRALPPKDSLEQNCGDNKDKIRGWQGMNRADFQGSENCEKHMTDPCHYTLTQTHGMYDSKTEPKAITDSGRL